MNFINILLNHFIQKQKPFTFNINIFLIIKMSLGVPLKIMHEAVHHIVTVELKSGETFTGYMAECEVYIVLIISFKDTMNIRLDDVSMITRDGRPMSLE